MATVELTLNITPAVKRRFPGSTITFGLSIYVDEVLTDASAVAFTWRMGGPVSPHESLAQFLAGSGNTSQTSVTPTHDGTGLYSAEVTPETGGNLYWRWDTEGALDTAREGVISIAETQFSL